ncbi:lipid-A-disaccharide synthase [Vibrio inusitatus NBRC 102082]|uniref:Lipid-A-disaccharide synthase n=1 Tax=Vibrio inusitatus NBRC 102082 TaxID=1219070 RepID=A0A4Y3HQE2_9VIBR|nr:lipid-A-disaccharide synthase [Vibrio inusitatus]GEA49363.1 lipid-A-disaccharide synthase [Vibrio inusitatus NBRC 102082]
MSRPLRIGVVVGELSGDTLGEGLIKGIQQRYPDAEFVGIAGPKMQALGCRSLFDMEELSVMGLVEVLGRLRRILHIKKEVAKFFKEWQPDVFIGIDAPDFNLRLELELKNAGLKTVHYVSPSVWAWRPKRIFKIDAATDLVLAFLPFEKAFYDKYNVACEFVGHTLADAIPLHSSKSEARERFGLQQDKRWIAVLPGSRRGEIKLMAEDFISGCKLLQEKYPDIGFIVSAVNPARRAQFEEIWQQIAPELDFQIIEENSARNIMAAADYILLACGTAVLEGMLVNRPMVTAYKVNKLSGFIAKRMMLNKYYSLPNLLADEELLKELIMEECNAQNIFEAMQNIIDGDTSYMTDKFTEMHSWIKRDADTQAATAVLNLIGK